LFSQVRDILAARHQAARAGQRHAANPLGCAQVPVHRLGERGLFTTTGAVACGSALRHIAPNYSLKRTNQSLRD
jgi:hypothetical protein